MRPTLCAILFCDIRGYTPIAEKLDPEVLESLLEGYVREMSAPVRRHRGTVDKVLGDGILACFDEDTGGDFAARALRAAVEMQERARALRPRWQAARTGVDLWVRIGIATGEVARGSLHLADRREPTAVGGPVNLASRLQEKAPPGGVLVCPETRRAVGDLFPIVPVEGLEVRGLDDALTAWLLPADEAPPSSPEPAAGWDGHDRRRVPLEKRRYRRIERHVALGIRIGETARPCRSLNVSEGGILLEVDPVGAVGSEVVLHVRLPAGGSGLPLDITGKVVRIIAADGRRNVGVTFVEAASASPATLARLVRDVFDLDAPAPRGARPGTGPPEVPVPVGPIPTLRGRELPLTFEELGTVDPARLMSRVDHEFQRTRRYGKEFSCITLRLDDLSALGTEPAAAALRCVAGTLAAALRSTDDSAYVLDGTFVILAPETMVNRASTLGERLAERVRRDLDGVSGAATDIPVSVRAFSFDGWNAGATEEVMRRVLAV